MPISTWEPSELDKQTQIAQQALARIAELEAMGTSESARLSQLLTETRAELAERDELIELFEMMWANVTDDHVADSVFHQYNKLMDRWTARAEEGIDDE